MLNGADNQQHVISRQAFSPWKKVYMVKDLRVIFGKSRGTFYNWINPDSPYFIPDFPKPIRIGKRSIGWLEHEILEYLEKLAKFRDQSGGFDGNHQ